MANRFLTRDEVTLEIAIPTMRVAVLLAIERFKKEADLQQVYVENPIRDCLPIMVERDGFDGPMALAQLAAMEVDLRKRIKEKEQMKP